MINNFFPQSGQSYSDKSPPRRNNKTSKMIEYPSVPALLGVVISKKLATLHELQGLYSYDDLWDLYEIVLVNNYNESLAMEGVK